MRVVFMGSALFSCPSLRALLADDAVDVVAAVTQPDRPRGRRMAVQSCAAKALAMEHGIPVLTPTHVNAPDSITTLRDLAPDVVVVVAYGQILKPELLAVKPDGFINVHASLLPRYRGAAPIQWAIARGETVTGVTTMMVDEGLDSGDILMRDEMPIEPDDNAETLSARLAAIGGRLLIATLAAYRAGTLTREPQDESAVTLAPKLKKADGIMDWTQAADALYNRVRAFNPWPVCRFSCRGKGGRPMAVRVLRADVVQGTGTPGEIVDVGPPGPAVATGQGALRLLEVQPEGKNAMSGDAFLRGRGLGVGDHVE